MAPSTAPATKKPLWIELKDWALNTTAQQRLTFARWIAFLYPTISMISALGSEYIGHLYPCEMCLWQRKPHYIAIGLMLFSFALSFVFSKKESLRPYITPSKKIFTLLAAFSIAVSGVIGAFHAGVEYHWWQGITTCSLPISGNNTQEMFNAIMKAPFVRCDIPAWTFFGISLAGFNAIFSIGGGVVITLLCLNYLPKRR
ncbi:MAG: disulfide bond formation protein B [Zymomonas mobilis subsp. pomaceae]|uniref:Disulfide bond formation protein DsbB n=1 Tax=Zymomonas mobilis subsp. pomaceae (strain ATCC 29192 / DSM 22645 / JCM 10191 / CCUG 17912 / NBRC 13757 / NCIMB 11200 / NRRL B-4491 / Barker I) TaxID=579138 RepID=F8EVK1_ZYMMT|nr:disulfide bond formation protein B [Zymomonas mobilis]AEI38338.1 disulfide bond formation protein DsbB [Zymomonas mobilis subsp. pomaceae ATCC 29192]MDX5948027.1 disulfide bond formation protein B [Zymomonas mobilis subsp. pomaceae]GEB89357.1 hypothetical protein ZMO02_09940 [Zymomonas mobilis subsp. pomaceae]